MKIRADAIATDSRLRNQLEQSSVVMKNFIPVAWIVRDVRLSGFGEPTHHEVFCPFCQTFHHHGVRPDVDDDPVNDANCSSLHRLSDQMGSKGQIVQALSLHSLARSQNHYAMVRPNESVQRDVDEAMGSTCWAHPRGKDTRCPKPARFGSHLCEQHNKNVTEPELAYTPPMAYYDLINHEVTMASDLGDRAAHCFVLAPGVSVDEVNAMLDVSHLRVA